MKTNGNVYEGENRSLRMKERIGYGVGDFANNMMYAPGSAVLGWVLAAFGFISSSATQPLSAINGIRVIFLYVPLVVFAAMFIVLLFYKLDKEYAGIVDELGKRR